MQPFKSEAEIKATINQYVEKALAEAAAHGWNGDTYLTGYLSGLMAGHALACEEVGELAERINREKTE